jgi:hypothetical protein
MQDVVAPEEPLTRFIFSSGHFSLAEHRVKHNAFLPTRDGETSVSRIEGLPDSQVWTIGQGIAMSRDQPLHARGDIVASDCGKARLEVRPSEPPPRHAVIVNWRTEKSEQKLQAMQLAENAKLVMPS